MNHVMNQIKYKGYWKMATADSYENDNTYSVSQMNDAVSCLTTGYQTYLFAQCHSGYILDGLDISSRYGTRYGMASAAETESSYSHLDEPLGFGYDFLNALNYYGMGMTTSQMAQHMLSNGTYVCPYDYEDNEECNEHAVYTSSGKYTYNQHTWDKGSNFQIFAQS